MALRIGDGGGVLFTIGSNAMRLELLRKKREERTVGNVCPAAPALEVFKLENSLRVDIYIYIYIR